jgi:hypothetical protein
VCRRFVGGNGRKINSVAREVERRLSINDQLRGCVTRIHVNVIAHAADDHCKHAFRTDRPFNNRQSARVGRECERSVALRTVEFNGMVAGRNFVCRPLRIL